MINTPQFILADDFTGANDVGIPFMLQGFQTVVVSDIHVLKDIKADVVVVNTDSRDCGVDEAERRVRICCQAIREVQGTLLYKKIDSTIRGHIGREIDVVGEIFGHRRTICAPAFPEIGRTTIGGYHLLNGRPVENESIFDGSYAGVRSAYLPDVIRDQSEQTVKTLELKTLFKGSRTAQRFMDEPTETDKTVVVADMAAAKDWSIILDAADRMQKPPLLCGSAGMAYPLAERFATSHKPSKPQPPSGRIFSGSALVIAGGIHPVTMEQIKVAGQQPDVRVCRIDPYHLLTDQARDEEINRVVNIAEAALSSGHPMIVALAPEDDADLQAWKTELKVQTQAHQITKTLATAIGTITKRILNEIEPGGLVLTGGETAAQVIQHLGGYGTHIIDAVHKGVARTSILGGPYEGMQVITKPGAFGDGQALLQAIRRIETETKISLPATGRPILGITIGDPNGVGPEVIAKALSYQDIYDISRPLVIGHAEVIRQHLKFASIPLDIHIVRHPAEGHFKVGTIDVLEALDIDTTDLVHGQVQEAAGRLAVESVIRATHLAMEEAIQAVVTAPLNKEAMNLAGYRYAGHTELLAELTGTEHYRLTLAFDNMLVSHVTTHVSLRQAIDLLSETEILATIEIIGQALQRMGIPTPRIAVCGLNPHAGEGGMFGDEEIRIIHPALEKARASGWHILGPLPPDTVFLRAQRKEFDGIVGMYHDQGHIPVKAIAFDRTVNVSLGMPIIRTSVDHGTAFDIAGQGIANEENLGAAIRLAVRLVGDRWSVKA